MVYERLVENFKGESRAVCDFIGAEWRDDLEDFGRSQPSRRRRQRQRGADLPGAVQRRRRPSGGATATRSRRFCGAGAPGPGVRYPAD